MCLIIDTNRVHLVFDRPMDPEYAPVWNALRSQKAQAVYGGELAREYLMMAKYLRLFKELERAGSLRRVADEQIDAETQRVRDERRCSSDDPHILALARVSGVRLLCTDDKTLTSDFTNPDLLHPRGSVYQNASHRLLIGRHCRKHRRQRAQKIRMKRR